MLLCLPEMEVKLVWMAANVHVTYTAGMGNSVGWNLAWHTLERLDCCPCDTGRTLRMWRWGGGTPLCATPGQPCASQQESASMAKAPCRLTLVVCLLVTRLQICSIYIYSTLYTRMRIASIESCKTTGTDHKKHEKVWLSWIVLAEPFTLCVFLQQYTKEQMQMQLSGTRQLCFKK